MTSHCIYYSAAACVKFTVELRVLTNSRSNFFAVSCSATVCPTNMRAYTSNAVVSMARCSAVTIIVYASMMCCELVGDRILESSILHHQR